MNSLYSLYSSEGLILYSTICTLKGGNIPNFSFFGGGITTYTFQGMVIKHLHMDRVLKIYRVDTQEFVYTVQGVEI